jgi:hypothetical protein
MPITRRKRANPPDQPENNNHLAEQTENAAELLTTEQASAEPAVPGSGGEDAGVPVTDQTVTNSFIPPVPPTQVSNGVEQPPNQTPFIEGGRRTARGELFRRPPQPPPHLSQLQPAAPVPGPTPLQPPTHEISLPLGNLLHLAYNPGYTGADEARSMLLQQLESQSKAGGRARCWNCGSIAIAYDRWNTRSKTFGEVGVAFCEICGVWSVL